MRAVCWMGKNNVEVRTVPDPQILNPRDAILRVTSTAICGSDLHLYDGYIPSMESGDILGHEFMGEVVEIGSEVSKLAVGDRVVVPFPIACGSCRFCDSSAFDLCDNSNPNAWMAEKAYGYSPAGIFGYSHMLGGYAGGQAQYVRVPFADVGPMVVPDDLTDDQVLFLSDIYPTGYHAAKNCDIQPGDTVAVWGCGPVGLFAIKSAYLLGAERVIAIDDVPERLQMAKDQCGGIPLNMAENSVLDVLKDITAGRGPDACIDAVGMEAHGAGVMDMYDNVKQALRLETGRPHALREAIMACGKGGTVSIAGVYGGILDKLPIGAAFNKSLRLRMGQTPVHAYMGELLDYVIEGRISPDFLITHKVSLEEAPQAYESFKKKRDGCIKVVLDPLA